MDRSVFPLLVQFSSVQSLSCVRLFAAPWTAALQASVSITNSWSLPKLMSMESVMSSIISSSVVPFSSCPQSSPASGSFPMSQLFASGGQSTGVSTSASVLPVNTQDWSPLGWAGWISLQSMGLSRVFSNTTQFKSINSLALSFLYSPTLTSIHDHWKSKDKKDFLRDQCKQIEENNRMGKTRDLFRKIKATKGTFHAR